MADVKYSVEVEYFTTGRIENPLARAKKDHEAWNRKVADTFSGIGGSLVSGISSVSDTITSTIGNALTAGVTIAAGAAAVAFGSAVKEGLKFNEQMEKDTVGIGGMIKAQGFSDDIEGGMIKSANLMAQMRKDAADLPGEMKDLVGIFRTSFTSGANSGMTPAEIEKMSARTMAFAAAAGINQAQAGRELAQLLDGRAGAHNVLGLRLGNISGSEAKKFNKMDPAKRVELLDEKLAAYDDLMKAYSTTFDAKKATLKDSGHQLLGQATTPLFEAMKKQMGKGLEFLDIHSDEISAFTSLLGNKIVGAFEKAQSFLERWVPMVWAFGQNLNKVLHEAFYKIHPFLTRLERFMGGRAANGADALVGGLKAAAELKAATMAAQAGMGIGKAAMPVLELAGLEGFAAMGVAAGAAAVALLAIGSVASVLTDTSSIFHSTAIGTTAEIQASSKRFAEDFAKLWVKLEPAVMGTVNLLGTAILSGLNFFVDALAFATRTIDSLAGVMLAIPIRFGLFDKAVRQPDSLLPHVDELHNRRHNRDGDNGDDDKKDRKPPQHTTHIHQVKIEVMSNQDPTRIAKSTYEIINDFAKHPRTSSFDPNQQFRIGF